MKAQIGRIKLVAVLLGAILAAASLIDLSGVAERNLWSEQEAAKMQEAQVRFHELAYATPNSSGLSAEEIAEQREQAKQRYDALKERLAAATSSPKRWRRIMLATAVVCLCVGLACHFASD